MLCNHHRVALDMFVSQYCWDLMNQQPCFLKLTNQRVVVMTGLTPCTRMVGGRSLVTVSNMDRKAEC